MVAGKTRRNKKLRKRSRLRDRIRPSHLVSGLLILALGVGALVILAILFGIEAIPAVFEGLLLIEGSVWGLGVLSFLLLGVLAELYYRNKRRP